MRAAFQQQPIHVSASDAQALPQHEIVQGLQEHTAAAHAVATTQATAAPALSPGSTPETTDKSIARRGSRRRSSLLRKKEHVLTKNYIEIARDFTLMQAFNRLPDGTYPPDTKCVFCGVGVPVAVFFPCQHRCVCDMCINRHSIAPANRKPSARSQCPVCMAEIRLILPHTGKEEEQYWAWVMEVQPQLPSYFKQEFKDAAKRLRKNSVAPTNNSHWSSSDTAADRQRRHCSIL
ncbi:TPA: hypothetical protein N0F65_001103 [Lagenidium giganteum]|uniref:RING-type domain-containing protein n=1 Tax=Lagenidium giganteum TaxID=4803 RepID=A0AAV2YMQ5_9STRA|nr:TPA: hypothetical protein N0F65_001103 [Lagenidium giganteum]